VFGVSGERESLWGVRRRKPQARDERVDDGAGANPKEAHVLDLQQKAGNAAVSGVVQRSLWGDDSWLGNIGSMFPGGGGMGTGGPDVSKAVAPAIEPDAGAGAYGGGKFDDGGGYKDPYGGGKFDDGGGYKDPYGGGKFDGPDGGGGLIVGEGYKDGGGKFDDAYGGGKMSDPSGGGGGGVLVGEGYKDTGWNDAGDEYKSHDLPHDDPGASGGMLGGDSDYKDEVRYK